MTSRHHYGPDPNHFGDLRQPDTRKPAGVVVVIHGGFWRAAFDLTHISLLCDALTGAGAVTWNLEYRRLGQPGGGWPGTLDDVVAAVERVPDLIGVKIGMDLSRPVLAGHSAGGHLALWHASRAEITALRGVLALAPVADLALAYRLGLGNGAVAELLGGGPADHPDRYASAQPGRPTVPVAIVHGTEDDVVPATVSRAYVHEGVRLIELPGVEHYAVIDPHSAAWSTVVGALGAIGT